MFFVAAGAGLLFYLWQYGPFSPGAREARRAENFIKDWEAKYKNDTYGGVTPEETLQLFITALKNGDTDLAAKYFLIDDQEKWSKYLKDVKSSGKLGDIIEEEKKLKLSKKDSQKAYFTIANNNIVEVQVVLGVSQNGLWKLLEL